MELHTLDCSLGHAKSIATVLCSMRRCEIVSRMGLTAMSENKAMILDAKSGAWYELKDGETVIGRSAKNDVALFGDMTVSRRHAVITRIGDDFVLDDLWSSNGTCINGVPISETVVLQPDDVIFLGERCLIFRPSQLVSAAQKSAFLSLAKIAGAARHAQNLAFLQLRKVSSDFSDLYLQANSGLKKRTSKPASISGRACNSHLVKLAAAVL